MKKFQLIAHIVAVVASALVSAIAASSGGGDPMIGATIGATTNSVIAYMA